MENLDRLTKIFMLAFLGNHKIFNGNFGLFDMLYTEQEIDAYVMLVISQKQLCTNVFDLFFFRKQSSYFHL